MKHDLVDAFWLKIFPITLGSKKRLFAEGTIPAAFRVPTDPAARGAKRGRARLQPCRRLLYLA
jgi:hypothetical protein